MDKTHYKELIEKYFEETITDVEIKELSDWIKNDHQLHDWWEQEFERSDSSMNPVLRDKLFAQIKEETLDKEVRPLRIIPWKWVAAILLPVCVAFFTYYLLDSSPIAETPFIVKAAKGDKATIELPDGTNVVLNSASQLSYLNNFGEKVRRVQLNGEAYFKVAHDEKHAFIVQIGDLEVKVLGTSFNISAYKDDKEITVVLLEGKVGVYAQERSHIMKPGDKIEYNKTTHQIKTTQVHPTDYIEWTKGNMYFEKESLENIMKTLSRIYDVEIRFDSGKLPKEYFTGTIPGGGIQNALNILMLTSPFYYEMDGSVIVLKEK
ncbi:Iron siderophore sensor protein [Bacteroides ovatus]|jgi:putative anti-sigma factor|uniref:FecR family protein n=1 Tax=Bacteroides TaxID=816 RepID=UPI000E97760A|nr:MULTISPECIES: FecR family protein [Bacteroides]MCS3177441.1 FecR family protein [Candidatus Bacteroides intestinigallinarum]RGN54964.1 FecR family protein [Bacteroides sp. OM05-10AA]RGQ59430.1 FecR family protein [Bacteroides sp. AF27-33]CAG9888934.1 Iron siderophore sensor protein [Bacteroides ovatus]